MIVGVAWAVWACPDMWAWPCGSGAWPLSHKQHGRGGGGEWAWPSRSGAWCVIVGVAWAVWACPDMLWAWPFGSGAWPLSHRQHWRGGVGVATQVGGVVCGCGRGLGSVGVASLPLTTREGWRGEWAWPRRSGGGGGAWPKRGAGGSADSAAVSWAPPGGGTTARPPAAPRPPPAAPGAWPPLRAPPLPRPLR